MLDEYSLLQINCCNIIECLLKFTLSIY